MKAYPFAMLISASVDYPAITHIPCIVEEIGDRLMIKGHMARINKNASLLDGNTIATIVFQGPHAYISPILYSNPVNVPTWNYIAVHASGKPVAVADERGGHKILEDTIMVFDPDYMDQYRELPAQYKEGLFKGIVAFTMEVDKLEAQFKLSQNKPIEDRKHIASVLLMNTNTMISEIGRYMSRQEEETNEEGD